MCNVKKKKEVKNNGKIKTNGGEKMYNKVQAKRSGAKPTGKPWKCWKDLSNKFNSLFRLLISTKRKSIREILCEQNIFFGGSNNLNHFSDFQGLLNL